MSELNYDEFAVDFILQLKEHSVKVSRIRDIDKLFIQLLSKAPSDLNIVDERMPYWADLWPSAIGISEYIDSHQDLVKQKQVIEIGCGLGLPGIVAALGGGKVIMTDYLQEALDFAKNNWNKNLAQDFSGQLLDWRNVSSIAKADVIIASDVAYESRSFEPLIKAFDQILKPDGVLLLSEPNRKFASPFIELLEKDFVLSRKDMKVVLDNIDYTISVYKGTRKL
ncbi:MAG: class I SAM-dependent methyltransferase [Bacteroidota bacterium]